MRTLDKYKQNLRQGQKYYLSFTIREWYMEKYPHDELGAEINPKATFNGLLNKIQTCLNSQDVYEYIGEQDSLIRERLFEKLSSILGRPYDYIYYLWTSN